MLTVSLAIAFTLRVCWKPKWDVEETLSSTCFVPNLTVYLDQQIQHYVPCHLSHCNPNHGNLVQVMYETNGFLEKNRDLLHADLLQLLSSCDSSLPQLFAAAIGEGLQKMLSPTRRANGTESQKQSVAAKFKVLTFLVLTFLLAVFQVSNWTGSIICDLIDSVMSCQSGFLSLLCSPCYLES
jgi:hypothetical protein